MSNFSYFKHHISRKHNSKFYCLLAFLCILPSNIFCQKAIFYPKSFERDVFPGKNPLFWKILKNYFSMFSYLKGSCHLHEKRPFYDNCKIKSKAHTRIKITHDGRMSSEARKCDLIELDRERDITWWLMRYYWFATKYNGCIGFHLKMSTLQLSEIKEYWRQNWLVDIERWFKVVLLSNNIKK